MDFNGVNATSLNLFSNINFDDLPDVPSESISPRTDVGYELKEANLIANIPNRFASVRLTDIDECLAPELKSFALKQSNEGIFLLFGQIGLGKTTAMCAAIHERRLAGLDCGYYFSMRNLLPKIRSSRSFSAKENEEYVYHFFSTTPFLCLDEIGTCSNRDEERDFLNTVICNRYDNYLPTMMATNLSAYNFKSLITGVDLSGKTFEEQKEICARLDKTDAVLNRIKSVAVVHKLLGESYRTRG